MNTTYRQAAAIMVTLLSAATVPAQTESAPEDPVRLRFELSPRGEYTFEGDLDDAEAEAAVGRAGLGSSLRYQASERLTLSLTLDAEASWYRFSGMREGGGDAEDLLEDAYLVSILPTVAYGIDANWSVMGGGIVKFGGEADADVGDSATFGGWGMARYAFSDSFSLSFGFGGSTRLEDDARFIPLFGVDWKISERVRLNTEGPGLRLTASVNERWAVWLSGTWESREYRLEDDRTLLPDGVARDERVTVRAGVTWNPGERVRVDAFCGAAIYQNYEFLDRNGVEVFDDNTDPALLVGLNATFRF